jgi:hypothetical protein
MRRGKLMQQQNKYAASVGKKIGLLAVVVVLAAGF